MCTTIIIDGKRIDCMGDLWGVVGEENVVMSHKASFEFDDCLCHVDMQATAAKAGLQIEQGWDNSSVDFVLTRKDGK